METGCKLGFPEKFGNEKLHSNAITEQSERESLVLSWIQERTG